MTEKKNQQLPLPVLYSFRRCPYAMRARLGLLAAGRRVILREIQLRHKPAHMLTLSPKGTVPVLWLGGDHVIDESLDIALWALGQTDPLNLLCPAEGTFEEMRALISQNDGPFKHHLDRTKYGTRYPGECPQEHREEANQLLAALSARLEAGPFLFGPRLSLADITIAPFVRQFANIDRPRFDSDHPTALRNWLDAFLKSELFQYVMEKYKPWQEGDTPLTFGTTELNS